MVQRIRPRIQVAGRLFVQTKKTKDPKTGWLGISISADATAVVKQDGETHIIRARPKPGEEDNRKEQPTRVTIEPHEPE